MLRVGREHLVEPGGLDGRFRRAAAAGTVEGRGLDDRQRLVVSDGVVVVEAGGRARAGHQRGERAVRWQLVLTPRVLEAPEVEAHADPVDGIRSRPVRRVRVVGRGHGAVAVRVERRGGSAARGGLVLPAGVRVAVALVGRPGHRGGRGVAMDRIGDGPERGDVRGRVLAPRVPGAVHLVGESDQRRHALGAIACEPLRHGLCRVRGHGGQTAPRLERDHEQGAGVASLPGCRVEVRLVVGGERERHEAHHIGRRAVPEARSRRRRSARPSRGSGPPTCPTAGHGAQDRPGWQAARPARTFRRAPRTWWLVSKAWSRSPPAQKPSRQGPRATRPPEPVHAARSRPADGGPREPRAARTPRHARQSRAAMSSPRPIGTTRPVSLGSARAADRKPARSASWLIRLSATSSPPGRSATIAGSSIRR